VIRALVRAGGVAVPRRGKGSHRVVKMPNGRRITVPAGRLRVGTLSDIIKESGLTIDEFGDLL
jgi:predicted RNA binding protein YcfA (HicA-like mRNA interferase family)